MSAKSFSVLGRLAAVAACTVAGLGAAPAALAVPSFARQTGMACEAAAQGVPACSSCHGPDAHGLQDFPRLAGQHGQYVLKQLASFRSNMRNVAIMHGVAQNLNLDDMDAVAAFLEAQP